MEYISRLDIEMFDLKGEEYEEGEPCEEEEDNFEKGECDARRT